MKLPSFSLDKLLIPLMIASLLPLGFILTQFFFKMQELLIAEERFDQLWRRSIVLEKKSALNHCFLNQIKNSDHFYIDKHLETLKFLESEIKQLQGSFHIDHNDFAKQRIDFLQNHNRLLFAEENIFRGENFQEVYERQQRPVELSEEDLKNLLSLIEGVSIGNYHPREGRPQLLFKDFELSKKMISSQEKVFTLSTQLLKREQLIK
jgi:hypothetical protein